MSVAVAYPALNSLKLELIHIFLKTCMYHERLSGSLIFQLSIRLTAHWMQLIYFKSIKRKVYDIFLTTKISQRTSNTVTVK
jgi:hypothetical protein